MKVKLLKCLVDQIVAIETASNDDINPDFGINTMETTGAELRSLTEAEKVDLRKGLDELSKEYSDLKVRTIIENLFDNMGVD